MFCVVVTILYNGHLSVNGQRAPGGGGRCMLTGDWGVHRQGPAQRSTGRDTCRGDRKHTRQRLLSCLVQTAAYHHAHTIPAAVLCWKLLRPTSCQSIHSSHREEGGDQLPPRAQPWRHLLLDFDGHVCCCCCCCCCLLLCGQPCRLRSCARCQLCGFEGCTLPLDPAGASSSR